MNTLTKRLDHEVIYGIIEPHSKVLDLGCGDGELLHLLALKKNARVQGIELDSEAIYQCVEKGLSVFHSDIDSGLSDYGDQSFDYVILNQSLQQVKQVEFVIQEAMRVGKKAILGFPNFAYLKARSMLFFRGMAPVAPSLPYCWANTPNSRFLSISDFKSYCLRNGIKILNSYYLGKKRPVRFWPNLLALNAVFVIRK